MKTQITLQKQSTLGISKPRPIRSWANAILVLTALSWLGLGSSARSQCEQECDLNHGNTGFGVGTFSNNTTGSANAAFGPREFLRGDVANGDRTPETLAR